MDYPGEDKEWASKYLLNPLIAPEPSQETGPGSHFTSTAPAAASASLPTSRASSSSRVPPSVKNSLRDAKSPTRTSYPTPPGSASPSQSSFHPSNPYAAAHRQSALGAPSSAVSSRKSIEGQPLDNNKTRRRGSSLGERFPGDMSHRPLDQIRKEVKTANRSPHLRKKHLPGADLIDSLDRSMGTAYHHEGPYDATLLSRNTNHKSSPVEAVKESNAEALRATPRENIRDALDKHLPLQGTAIIPSGMAGLDGTPMQYEEGTDLMRETDAGGGAYKRWPDMKYHPDDLKGKGEPSFTIERALKEDAQNSKGKGSSDRNQGYEMQTPANRPRHSHQRRSASPADLDSRPTAETGTQQGEVRRSNTTGRQVGQKIKKRFGGFRKGLRSSDQ